MFVYDISSEKLTISIWTALIAFNTQKVSLGNSKQ